MMASAFLGYGSRSETIELSVLPRRCYCFMLQIRYTQTHFHGNVDQMTIGTLHTQKKEGDNYLLCPLDRANTTETNLKISIADPSYNKLQTEGLKNAYCLGMASCFA